VIRLTTSSLIFISASVVAPPIAPPTNEPSAPPMDGPVLASWNFARAARASFIFAM
jgi:hypothetical protein